MAEFDIIISRVRCIQCTEQSENEFKPMLNRTEILIHKFYSSINKKIYNKMYYGGIVNQTQLWNI